MFSSTFPSDLYLLEIYDHQGSLISARKVSVMWKQKGSIDVISPEPTLYEADVTWNAESFSRTASV